jgi:hypothetical protein
MSQKATGLGSEKYPSDGYRDTQVKPDEQPIGKNRRYVH